MTEERDHTVLVVEDERDLADLYAEWLDATYSVETAYDGAAAIELLDDSIDVVLLDRRMPGLSGDEVLERIRSRGVDCRVAMVTAVEPGFDIIEMGFDDYLVKPVTREDLYGTVERLLARSTYDVRIDELVTLVTKKTALEAEKSASDLANSEEFERLEARIEEIRSEIDPIAQGFGSDDVAALLRDVPASTG